MPIVNGQYVPDLTPRKILTLEEANVLAADSAVRLAVGYYKGTTFPARTLAISFYQAWNAWRIFTKVFDDLVQINDMRSMAAMACLIVECLDHRTAHLDTIRVVGQTHLNGLIDQMSASVADVCEVVGDFFFDGLSEEKADALREMAAELAAA